MFLQLFLLFIIFFLFTFYIGARLHLCALSFRTMVFAAPDWAERHQNHRRPRSTSGRGALWAWRRHISYHQLPRGWTDGFRAAVGLASESRFRGRIDEYDCSYYQLFRYSFWACFYRVASRLNHWLLAIYRGGRIIHTPHKRLCSNLFFSQNIQKKDTF